AFAGDVAHRFDARGQAHLGDLTKRRVRLLRGRGVNPGADAAALRTALQGRDLVARGLVATRLADELVDCRHLISALVEACPVGPKRLRGSVWCRLARSRPLNAKARRDAEL